LAEPMYTGQPVVPTTNTTVAIYGEERGKQRIESLTWIRNEVSEGLSRFSKFYRQCQEADTFYNGEFDFDVPEGGTHLRLGTYRSVVKTGVDHIAPSFIDVSVPPRSSRAAADAEQTEKFLVGANHMAEMIHPSRREIVKHQFMYGVAWRKVEFAGTEWADFPEPPKEGDNEETYRQIIEDVLSSRDFSFPFIQAPVNPQELIWDLADHNNPKWIIRRRKVRAEWVRGHFPDWERRRGKISGDVPFYEVWTKDEVAYVADEHWAMPPRRHSYGMIPFIQHNPQTGIATKGNKPDHLYQGIGHGNYGMLSAQSQLASQFIDITKKTAWASREVRGPAGLAQNVIDNYSDEPGAINHIPPGVDVSRSDIAEAPQSILVGKEILDGAIEEVTVSKIARGQRPSGAASGYHAAVLAGIAALGFGSIQEATERGIQKGNELFLRIVESVIRDKVTVWGKTEAGNLDATIRPRNIRGHYVNIVRLNTVAPEEQERKTNLWSNMWRAGFVDHQTALRNAGISNPLEVSSAIAAEQFFKSEIVQQAFAQAAAQSIPLLQQQLQAAAQAGGAEIAQDAAANILNTQGSLQLPNPGNFSAGNQAGIRPASPGGGIPATTRPVLPGSAGEANLVARQLSAPRGGNVRVPGRDLAPGGVPAR
jgi:hypothetical protein